VSSIKTGMFNSSDSNQTPSIPFKTGYGDTYFVMAGQDADETKSLYMGFNQTDATAKVNGGKTNFPYQIDGSYDSTKCYAEIKSGTVYIPQAKPFYQIKNVTVPQGTYYSGMTVPITVELDNYAVIDANTRLLVNGTEASPLDSANTLSKKFTFGYKLEDICPVVINVTGISGLCNVKFEEMSLDGRFDGVQFNPDNGVTIVPNVKRGSFNTYFTSGISDDEPGSQVFTVLIKFKEGAAKDWLANETEPATTNGKSISMPVPGYADGTSQYYVKGMYFSVDGGKTRYPVYVIDSGGEEGVALAARFTPPTNESTYLRQDKVQLFMDTNIISDAGKYLDTAENAKIDGNGYLYFDGTDKEEANIYTGFSATCYVKGGIMFDPAEYISRGEIDYTDKIDTENG
ncbi:MAG: hypothetical protein VZR73_17125, partial [Acutalibacteraceae bacterium]|nr:hypothetical protein [Acutalibacteraceae bacterium]